MSDSLPPVAGGSSRRVLVIAISVVAVVAIAAVVTFSALSPTPASTPSVAPTKSTTPTPTPTPTPSPTPTFDKTKFSNDDASSLWVVANKQRPLNPTSYEPNLVFVNVAYAYEPYLTPDAAAAVIEMFAAFEAETGLGMQSQSTYRSYWSQERVYAGWVSSLGQEAADLTSARPGHSEHQTGLSIDVNALPANCTIIQCFAGTPQGQWLDANSWKHGYIVRYPLGKTDITGYEYEPWHLRFVGKELAAEMHSTGIQTLEEFFGLPAAPAYA